MAEDSRPPPDIELGATVRMKKLKFDQEPEVETSVEGDVRSETERENLPSEVEAGKTYRDARIRKHVEVRLDEEDRLDEEEP